MPLRRITLSVAGDTLVGHLHLPAWGSPGPAVVVAGPMTSVKEQVTGVYAAALAWRGIAALAIDHRGFGESEGQPRQYEHHARKVEDLRAALGHLEGCPEVAPERLGLVGVCLGAGYAACAAAQDSRVRSLAAVAGYYRDPEAIRASDPAGFDARVEQGIAARRHFEATGEVLTVPAAALSGDAAMTGPDTHDYYTRRAAVPNYVNAHATMSREHFLPFDVQAAAPRLTMPVLMLHSERALSPAWARQFHAALPAAPPIQWLHSSGQTDFYDDPSLVGQAADAIAVHLSARDARDNGGARTRPVADARRTE